MKNIKQLQLTTALLCVILFFGSATSGYGQKLKADGYKIAIQKNAEHKQTNMHGKIYVSYKGTIKVNSKDTLKGMYQFAYIDMGNSIGNISFKDKSGKTSPPKLLFDGEKGFFSYNKKDGGEGQVKREMFLPVEEVVLQGMLLWLKIKNEIPLD